LKIKGQNGHFQKYIFNGEIVIVAHSGCHVLISSFATVVSEAGRRIQAQANSMFSTL